MGQLEVGFGHKEGICLGVGRVDADEGSVGDIDSEKGIDLG